MGLIKEFREFAVKGNVLDMAVGIIIGAAFGKVVNSAVADIIMPPIGWLIGDVNFSDLAVEIPARSEGGSPVTWPYGKFLQTVFEFLVQAWAVFLVIKAMNSFKREEEVAPAAPPPPPDDVKLLTEIRDLLKKK